MEDTGINEWLQEKYEVLGLVGLVNVKGFEPSYTGLVQMLEDCGIEHGLDAVSSQGLGRHIDEVFRRACNGETSSEIAAAFGVKTKTLSRFCRRHGIELEKRLMLRDLDDEIRECAKDMTVPMMSRHFGFSEASIRKYCVANNIMVVSGKPGYYFQNGYKLVRVPSHPNACGKGYVREHRLVQEEVEQRILSRGEVVHHKNGDKLDNRPENLEVMTLSEHARLHATAGDTGWDVHHQRKVKKI